MAVQDQVAKVSERDHVARRARSTLWRYGLSVVSVAISLALTLVLEGYIFRTPLFFPAILLSTWFGGRGPGLLAVLLSTLCINFFMLEPRFAFSFSLQDSVHLSVFLFSALLISSWSTARRRAENRLRESEQRWRGLTEALPQLVWGATADGACNYFSTQWTSYTGVPENELLGWQWMKVLHPDDRDSTRKFWTESIQGRAPYDVEYRVKRADGVYGWFKTRGAPIRDEHGKIEKWFGTCTDITDRKQAESSLRESEGELRKARDQLESKVQERTADLSRSNEQLRLEIEERERAERVLAEQASLLDLTHDTIFVRDMNDVITYWNRGAEERYGWSNKEAVGRVTHELMQTSFPAPLAQINEELLAAGRWDGELIQTRRDGTTLTVASRWSLQRDNAGRPVAILETNNDITERKQAEENLRNSEAFLAQGQRISQTGSWRWNVRSGSVTWSEEHFRIFGLKPEETEPSLQLFLDSVHPGDRSFITRSLEEAAKAKQDFDLEFRVALPDGSVKHVQGVGRPVVGESGEVERYVGTTMDISARKQAEALLTGEKRLLEMIATGVPLKEILDALCLIIEEQRSGTLASVLLQNPDGVHLNVVAAPNLPNEWICQMEKMPIGPCAGSCGTAAFRGTPVIVADIATDPLWDVPQHRAAALQHGLRASWSNPVLSSSGKVLGTFCIYHREARAPNGPDFELIELATHITRVAIERDRAEDALRASEQLARGQVEALAQSLDVLATAPEPEKFIGQMLTTIGRLLSAQSVALWLFDQATDSLVFRFMVEGADMSVPDPEHPFAGNTFSWKDNPMMQELLFTAGPVVCEDVETDPRVNGAWRTYLQSKGTKRFLAVPTLVGGEVKGFIGVRHGERLPYRPEEIELTQALAHQVMLALQLNDFAAQAQRAAVFEERNRMARDIHDTLAQGFTGVIIQLEAAEDAISSGDRDEGDKHLHRAGELARRSLSEARRSVHALRPHALQKHNFWDALKGVIKNTTVGTALHTTFAAQGKLPDLPQTWQENLLHIGQEALTNTLKYARARNFETQLSYRGNELRLELRDDGDGFQVNDSHDGFGLTGMRERAEQMGGALSIESLRGKGTNITVVVPCEEVALV